VSGLHVLVSSLLFFEYWIYGLQQYYFSVPIINNYMVSVVISPRLWNSEFLKYRTMLSYACKVCIKMAHVYLFIIRTYRHIGDLK